MEVEIKKTFFVDRVSVIALGRGDHEEEDFFVLFEDPPEHFIVQFPDACYKIKIKDLIDGICKKRDGEKKQIILMKN